jgi:outer membrane protein assembly factor BamB
MNTHSHKRNRLFLLIQTLVFFCVFGCANSPRVVFGEPTIVHEILVLNNVEFLWSMDNVYTMQNDFEPAMITLSDLVCFLGDVSYPPNSILSCINTETREIAWQKFSGSPAGMATLQNYVFVPYYGEKGVEKYDIEGNMIWDYPLTGHTYIYSYENQIQLFSIPEKFRVLNADNGARLEEVKGKQIIFSTATERFVKGVNLESRSMDMNVLNWSVEIGNKYLRLKPLFTENTIFFRTGQISGSVYAVNKQSGEILWQTDSNMIGNIIYLHREDKVVVLTRDGKLLVVDAKTGVQTVLVEFSETPFVLNGESATVVGGYELAYDENSKTIYLLLGDSRQLFAFRVD